MQAGRVLGASLDYHATLAALADLLVPGLADGCVVRLTDEEFHVSQVHIAHRDARIERSLRDYYRRNAQQHGEQPPIRRLLEQGEPILLEDAASAALVGAVSPEWRELVMAIGLRSLVAVPMIAGGRSIGVLSLGTTSSERRYGEGDLPLVLEIAARAATAVDHARLHHAEREARATAELAAEEMRRLHEYQERLYTIIEGLDRQRTLEDAARFISATAAGATGALASWVGTVDPARERVTITSALGYPSDMVAAYQSFPLDRPSPAADAIRLGTPVFLADIEERRERYPTLRTEQDRMGGGALAAIPLLIEERVAGVMGFTFAEPRPFLPVERDFLQAIGRHAAIALDRLQLDAELRSASERLDLERSRLMTVVEQMPAGVIVGEAPSGRIVLHNARAAAMLGHPLDGLLGESFTRLGARHPDGTPFTAEEYPLMRALRGETVEQERVVYLRADGTFTRLTVSSAPIRDGAGRIVFAVSAVQDVSDQARMEEELRHSRERLEQVLAAARMGTWVWDLGSKTVTWDENMAAVLALAPGHSVMSLSKFFELVHPDDRDFVETVVARAAAEGTSLDYEFRAVCPDGVTRWIASQGRVFADERNHPTYLAGVGVDITDRKVAEAQLREAQKMEAVGRLAGGMAHEINNMMSVVLGFTEFLGKDESLSATAQEDVAEIRKAAERAAGVTRQVLAFSRQQVMVTETLELNAVISEAEQLLRRVLGTGIELVVSLQSDAGHVRADPNQLNQVLVNLALNSKDAMAGPGRVTIRTSGRRLDERDLRGEIGIDIVPGDYVELIVADTGQGMDQATLARAFEPFFTTKAVGEGTGLGLSTVYGVVKQSHGYVWAESAPGRGTEFHLAFPRVEPTAESIGRLHRTTAASGQRSSARVLLVEDEVMVRSIARRSLEAAGYDVVEAEDGVGALGVLASGEAFDLILTDIIMPRMTGRELGRQVRQRWPRLPVLYMSGHPSEEMLRRGLLLEDEHFVQKPFRPERLVGDVARVLGR